MNTGSQQPHRWQWFVDHLRSPHSSWWLALFAFLEPIFLPLWPESVMVALTLADRSRWKRYAAITAAASIAGAIVGYLIGVALFHWFGAPAVRYFDLHRSFRTAHAFLAGNILLVMMFLMFAPVPDKVFVILSGFLHIPFLPFIVGFGAGRIGRVFLVAYVVEHFGEKTFEGMRRYFGAFALVIGLVIVWAVLRVIMR